MSREAAYKFFRTVEQMRLAQKEYFRTKSQESLSRSMELERQVDAEIKRTNDRLSGVQSLNFDQ